MHKKTKMQLSTLRPHCRCDHNDLRTTLSHPSFRGHTVPLLEVHIYRGSRSYLDAGTNA